MTEGALAVMLDAAFAWLATYLVHSTLFIGGVGLSISVTRPSTARRDLLWKTALVGGMLTTTLQTALDLAPLAGHLSPAASISALATWLAGFNAVGNAIRHVVPALANGPASVQGSPVPATFVVTLTRALALVWLIGGAIGAARLLHAHRRFRAHLADRHPVQDIEQLALLDSLLADARRVYSIGTLRLSTSPRCHSPMALGLCEICIPEWVGHDLEPLERRSVLAHELAHIARRDPLWQFVALLAARLLWPQPLNILVRRRLGELAEFACDDWAVERTGTPLGMLRSLAMVAERLPGRNAPPATLASAMAHSTSPLLVRAIRIANGRCERPRRAAWLEVVCAVGIVAAVGLAAPLVSGAHPAGAASTSSDPGGRVVAPPPPAARAHAGVRSTPTEATTRGSGQAHASTPTRARQIRVHTMWATALDSVPADARGSAVDSIVEDVLERLPAAPLHAGSPRVYVVQGAALRHDRSRDASAHLLTALGTEQARAILTAVEEATRAGWPREDLFARLATIVAESVAEERRQ